MTEKAKALEIIESFRDGVLALTLFNDKEVLVKCAIIHVIGIIDELENLIAECKVLGMWSYCDYRAHLDKIEHWKQVLTELNQM